MIGDIIPGALIALVIKEGLTLRTFTGIIIEIRDLPVVAAQNGGDTNPAFIFGESLWALTVNAVAAFDFIGRTNQRASTDGVFSLLSWTNACITVMTYNFVGWTVEHAEAINIKDFPRRTNTSGVIPIRNLPAGA